MGTVSPVRQRNNKTAEDVYVYFSQIPSVFELYLIRKWVAQRYPVDSLAVIGIKTPKEQEYLSQVFPSARTVSINDITEDDDYKLIVRLNAKVVQNPRFDNRSLTLVAKTPRKNLHLSDIASFEVIRTPLIVYGKSTNAPSVKGVDIVHLSPRRMLSDLRKADDGLRALIKFLQGDRLDTSELGSFIHDMNMVAQSTVFNWNGLDGVYYLVLTAVREYFRRSKPVKITALSRGFKYHIWYAPEQEGNDIVDTDCKKCIAWRFSSIVEEFEPKPRLKVRQPTKEVDKSRSYTQGANSTAIAYREGTQFTSRGQYYTDVQRKVIHDSRLEGQSTSGYDESVAAGSTKVVDTGAHGHFTAGQDTVAEDIAESKKAEASPNVDKRDKSQSTGNSTKVADNETQQRLSELELRFRQLQEEYRQLQEQVSSRVNRGDSNQTGSQVQIVEGTGVEGGGHSYLDLDKLPTLGEVDPRTGQVKGSPQDAGNTDSVGSGISKNDTTKTEIGRAAVEDVAGTVQPVMSVQTRSVGGSLEQPSTSTYSADGLSPTTPSANGPSTQGAYSEIGDDIDVVSKTGHPDGVDTSKDPIQAIIDELEK